ncbi:hypothetical protein [Rhodococcus sp. AD45]|uniref:hypothetical protein n=1 Tax=Rhodococcus sp. (strain AD45) TaxID=103808 RepID=UPI0013922F6D|nr:hypothetical protein [Rhodococcus sp. AD45]
MSDFPDERIVEVGEPPHCVTSEQVADLAEEVRSLATRAHGVDLTSVDTDALRRELASRSALPRRSPSEN